MSRDEFLRLACLTYDGDDRERQAQARTALSGDPSIGRGSVFHAACAGDVAALDEALALDPGGATATGGPFDWPPMLYATYSRANADGASAVVRRLLESGADPGPSFLSLGARPRFTALTGAFGSGEDLINQPPHPAALDIARALLEAGADANDAQTIYNRHFLPGTDYLELLYEFGLGQGADGAVVVEDALLFAVTRGYEDRVALLLARGVDPNGRGSEHPALSGRSASRIAYDYGLVGVAAALLDAGADPFQPDDVDRILAACMRGAEGEVDAALKVDPSLAERAVRREPDRLRVACELGRVDAVPLLVSLGYSPNARDGRTALHEAAFRGDRRLVDLLLSLGADPIIRDTSYAATPAGWAAHNGHDRLATYLHSFETA